MILAIIPNSQRVYLVRLLVQAAGDLTTVAKCTLDNLMWRVMNGYQDRDGILFELSPNQRSAALRLVTDRMNVLGSAINGWLNPEYAALEALVYNLTVGAAD